MPAASARSGGSRCAGIEAAPDSPPRRDALVRDPSDLVIEIFDLPLSAPNVIAALTLRQGTDLEFRGHLRGLAGIFRVLNLDFAGVA